VLLLAEHFLKMFRATMNKNVDGFTPAARQKLLRTAGPATSANCATSSNAR
jgi:DNA-binding NtrC family response regulator